jgi:hypothetical protein
VIEFPLVPFDHKYVPPPFAVNVAKVEVHVNTEVEGVIEAVGGVVFPVTTEEAIPTHPVGVVTVTEYVFAAVTVIEEVVAPVDHK